MPTTPDPIAEFYNQNCEDEWQRLERHRTEYALTWKAFEQYLPPPPARILDCGCGPGRHAIELARRGYAVTLFDLSAGILELARKKAEEAGVILAGFEQGSAVDLSSFPDNHFEAVLIMGPFYHLLESGERSQAIREARRVLKPGGVILASFISRYSGHRDVAKKTPEFLLYGDDVLEEILKSGRLLPRGVAEAEFIAYFSHPSEIPGFFWQEGLEFKALLGVEGLVSMIEEGVNGLSGDAWERWVELNYRIASDPSIHGLVEHLLAVVVKPAWRGVLAWVAGELDQAGLEYKLSGGASAALHGVWLPVKDLDFEMGAEQAYRFQHLFQEYGTQPVALSASDLYRSHFGKFAIDGVGLEVMGDLQRREGDIWKPTWARTLDLIDLDGVSVRTSWLEEETLAYMRRGRLERAAQCLLKCDPERLNRLLHGEEPCGVL